MEKRTFDEILDFAIQKEDEAADGYRALSEGARRSNVRDMLMRMSKQEAGHATKLRGINREKVETAAITKVPDLKIADYSDNVNVTPDMSYQDVLTVAIKREQKAHNLYMTLASNTDDQGLKKLFQVLAQEEAKHKLDLETEYDEHILTEN